MSKSNNERTYNLLETQQQQKGEKQHQTYAQKDGDNAEHKNLPIINNATTVQGRRRRENKNSNNSSKKNKTQFNATTTTLASSMPKNATTATTETTPITNVSSQSIPTTSSSHAKFNTTSFLGSLPPPSTATQFSVQRSDTDGLRMRISAIRPNPIQPKSTRSLEASSNSNQVESSTTTKRRSTLASTLIVGGGDHANNNTLKVKISNKFHPPQAIAGGSAFSLEPSTISSITSSYFRGEQNLETSKMEINTITGSIAASSSSSNISFTTTTNTLAPTMSTIMSQAYTCLSDATESGLSEATTTTVAAAGEKATKRVKLKRKKVQLKSNDSKKLLKKSRQQNLKPATFSSDTDEDEEKVANENRLKPLIQRAPRLLLTAINSKSSLPQIKTLAATASSTAATASTGVGSDNIGLSSSDNELPDLVNAAIKRFESDTDDNVPIAGLAASSCRRSKTKHLQQYQSTLLQDFMEKTQMLGQANVLGSSTLSASTTTTLPAISTTKSMKLSSDIQSDSVASSGGEHTSKKRRGRPKKSTASVVDGDLLLDDLAKPMSASNSAAAANINESGDSGVISTTSTTQSTSPSPKLLLASSLPSASARSSVQSQHQHQRHHGKHRKQSEANTTDANKLSPFTTSQKPQANLTAVNTTVSSTLTTTTNATAPTDGANVKPKIDIAYLDKRMYAATERVLYPPPRNKRRQSMSAVVTGSSNTSASSERKGAIPNSALQTATPSSSRVSKEELDPVWKKIDVNKKFRRPSLSGYKSDGGGGNTTICSKILAAKSGYVSDYGSSFIGRSSHHHHSSHNSGYKSDASCKSRYSVKSCASRRSRAKSCGYRSDCKEGLHGGQKSVKFRRKRRCSMLFSRKMLGDGSGGIGNPNDEQDILQLAGLTLGQSSEESNEYVCKPNLDSLPSTSVSKKYGEINRFIATGEYFGRGSSGSGGAQSFAGLTAKRLYELNNQDDASQDGYGAESTTEAFGALSRNSKLQIPRKEPLPVDELTTQDLLPITSRKIKSRRSSAASYCSSYYSGVSKIRRRKRRKSFRYPTTVVDSKLLTEIDIMTNTFGTLCRIQANGASNTNNASSTAGASAQFPSATTDKDKPVNFGGSSSTSNGDKLQASSLANAVAAKRDARDKRSLKKRKMSENLDFAILSAAVANATGSATPSSGGSSKRRHKKTNSSSPDDHKLPLKKRHYLLTPGEKSAATEAAVAAVAAKLFANNSEAWAAAAAVAKSTVTAKAQQQQFSSSISMNNTAAGAAPFSASTNSMTSKGGKTGLTPKKRHLLQNSTEDHHHHHSHHSHGNSNNSSPLRVVVDGVSNSISGGKLLDISPLSLSAGSCSTKHSSTSATAAAAVTHAVPAEVVHKKRSRLEGLVTKIATASNVSQATVPEMTATTNDKTKEPLAKSAQKTASTSSPQLDSETSCPPPGIFEPSVELEIQNITKISEAAASIITKSEVDSPLLMEISKSFGGGSAAAKNEGTRVIETLLNKTGANLILRRKRKKFNRTGFPTVRRKKRKINEQLLLDVTPDISEQVQRVIQTKTKEKQEKGTASASTCSSTTSNTTNSLAETCGRVPQTAEASNSFLQRANRTPRLSVVSLERLQGVFASTASTISSQCSSNTASKTSTPGTPKQTPSEQGTKASRPKIVASNKKQKQETLKTPVPKTQKKSHEPKTNTVNSAIEIETAERQKAFPPVSRPRGRISKLSTASARTEETMPIKKEIKSTKRPTDTPTLAAAAKRDGQLSSASKSTSGKSLGSSSTTRSPTRSQSTAFTKSSVQKIITAKSLEAKVKLPAGIDPNTNFSCKIRLKRRNALFPQLSAAVSKPFSNESGSGNNIAEKSTLSGSKSSSVQRTRSLCRHEEPDRPAAEIDAEAALKDPNIDYAEHDALPLEECSFNYLELFDVTNAGDTSDEKSSSSGNGSHGRKLTVPIKKNYLPAGLFSSYFKCDSQEQAAPETHTPQKRKSDMKIDPKDSKSESKDATKQDDGDTAASLFPLLPPPPYCERYFRRERRDFQLPYDIYWAYTHNKLPKRNTVPSWQYRKIRTNIYAESVRPNMAGFDHPTCNCKPESGCSENCLNRMVYTECSPSNCPTREKCLNQKIQRHEVAPGVERFMTTDKGWGVRTKLHIKKGTYILEYVGEVVTEREFKDRMGLIYQNDTHHYCLHLDGGLVIDGHRMGSDGRFVNHSCMPNCEMQKWSVNGLSRMALFAARNIESGEELTYDYNFSLFNPSEGQPCRCNTAQCRGVIGGKSQRIKPLPADLKANELSNVKDSGRSGRQRKRKASKSTQRNTQSKEIAVARVQQLSEKEKKLVKQYGIFLVRSFEKIRRYRARKRDKKLNEAKPPKSPVNAPISNSAAAGSNGSTNACTPATITSRRPSTPSSLAAQISALCSPRSIKTRGLMLAVQDPEVEKMAKMAVILRDICAKLAAVTSDENEDAALLTAALSSTNVIDNSPKSTESGVSSPSPTVGHKKKKSLKTLKAAAASASSQASTLADFKTLQANIEQGFYKQPNQFDDEMQNIFSQARSSADADKIKLLDKLIGIYEQQKELHYTQLLELIEDESALTRFCTTKPPTATEELAVNAKAADDKQNAVANSSTTTTYEPPISPNEDIIRCICGLYKDEGLMIQCARCMVWQHTECTKADVDADNYLCERCEPRTVDREIQLDDFTEEGHRYFLTLMRGDLQVRQGDAVYVLRDIPIKDATGKVVPMKKHTYETIGNIDYNECDIFRVERLWKDNDGKRFVFGHHFLRPHETFHEPSRRFFPNEVVRVPLYEVVPIELIIGRCWVLDKTTFCKGRPIECNNDDHCYICELRVDKSAHFFSKAKISYPTCTKDYAFRKFPEKLKISKTYAPHDVDPAMLKTKKQKTETEVGVSGNSTCGSSSPLVAGSNASHNVSTARQEHKANQRKRQSSTSPANGGVVHLLTPTPLPLQTLKKRRQRLEDVLASLKLQLKNTQQPTTNSQPPIDLSYLLSGRGARQRKTLKNNNNTTATVASANTSNLSASGAS